MEKRSHPWILSLRESLNGLETALISGDALAVEKQASAVQMLMSKPPKKADFAQPASGLQSDLRQAGQHFAQLHQTVLRAGAKNQRAVKSLMPQHAQPATYGSGRGSGSSGAGRAFLSA